MVVRLEMGFGRLRGLPETGSVPFCTPFMSKKRMFRPLMHGPAARGRLAPADTEEGKREEVGDGEMASRKAKVAGSWPRT